MSAGPGKLDRSESLARLNERFDIAIVGGGATGLGAAVDAATRGFKVVLVEARDFAQGTSSRSTKLVHGGVRYLAQGNIGLVREALRERGRLRRNAAHLVGDLEFVVPAYAWWSGPYYGVGLKLYDVLAGRYRLKRSQIISRAQVLERIPTLEPEDLRGGIVYFDGQFDDARLAVTLAATASAHGAVLLNHAPVVSLIKEGERISGVVVRDEESQREHRIQARCVINATGVFADSIRRMDDAEAPVSLSPSQGVHLVLPGDFLPSRSALMVPKTDDGRVLFVVPWHGRAVLGTTDTPMEDVQVEPKPREDEIAFLLEHAGRYLARAPQRQDVLAVYAGLRPLVRARKDDGNTQSLSRDHTLMVSESGLLTIVGGKWTTYRKMAEDVVDRALEIADLPRQPCVTADLKLWGAPEQVPPGRDAGGTPSEALSAYGTFADEVRGLAETDPTLAVPIHPRLPYLAAEVVWAVRYEMARSLEDVLSRRLRALILDARAAGAAAPAVARRMAAELGRDDAWIRQQLAEFEKRVAASLL